MTLVSVITPSYNSPDLYATIDSVLMQNYDNIQYIIVDDGSRAFDKQKVCEYINKHSRGNVTAEIAENGTNKGTVYTMNVGMSLAKGEYIINLAGDDCFFDENVVADIVNEFKKTGALIITGLRCVYDSELKRVLNIRPKVSQCRLVSNVEPRQLFEAMAGSNFIFGCCTARSRECVEKYGLYNEKYRYIEDYSMNMYLLRNGVKFHFFDRIFVKYRSGGVSFASNISEAYIEEANEIFKNEIEPYSCNPVIACENYFKWKKNALDVGKFSLDREKCGGNIAKIAWLYLKFFIKHPRNLLSIIYSKIEAFRSNIKYGN